MTRSTKMILVTGGAGFIGSCFVRKRVQEGHHVVVLDALTYAGHRENLEGIRGPGSCELVVGNICDDRLVRELLNRLKPDAVVNFAAESHVDRSINGPSIFIETNVRGTMTLLSASLEYWKSLEGPRKESFRYVQISTDEVFGALGPEGKFSETTPYAPNSPYSASKAAADHLVNAWHHTYGLPTIITNCSNNYGPYQYPEKLIPHMIISGLAGNPLPVYGKGANIRDWIHVEDHCDGIWLALTKGRPGQSYCFGGDAERKNIDVVRELCRLMDEMRPREDGLSHESSMVFVADRLGHDFRYAIDDSKARTELGFERKYSFEKGLANTVRWYLANLDWAMAVLGGKTIEGNHLSWRKRNSALPPHAGREQATPSHL